MKYYIASKNNLVEKTGKLIESFKLFDYDFFLVKSGKYQQIVFNTFSVFHNVGLTGLENKELIKYFSYKLQDINKVLNFVEPFKKLPIKEKEIKPKKIYHKFKNTTSKGVEDLRGICVSTFTYDYINFEVFRHKKTNYICYNGFSLSTMSEKDFISNLRLYDYSISKINNWINQNYN